MLINYVGGNINQGFPVDSDQTKWGEDIDLNFGMLLRITHAVLPR